MKVGLDDFLAANGADALRDLQPIPLKHGAFERQREWYKGWLRRRRASQDEGKGERPTYSESDGGIVWRKPSRDGVEIVRLTNFTARIVGQVTEDDGVEPTMLLEIEGVAAGRTRRFTVLAQHFNGLGWVIDRLGAGAIVEAGAAIRDRARAAIQELSGDVPERTVYTHTGWREHEGQQVFLSASGAIGADGSVSGIEVDLRGALELYRLPEPPVEADLKDAVRASLDLLTLGPQEVLVPLLGATFRAPLGNADFSIHLTGRTGAFKSELVARLQQHFGDEMDARHLPGNWSSTENAIEGAASSAKDVLFVIDDFAPEGTRYDVDRLHRGAARVFRAQGNRSGRQRMRSDGTLRPVRHPRGLIISTGEDSPRGHSIRARMLVLELEPGAIKREVLSVAQGRGADGLYAKAMAGYVRWIAPRYVETCQRMQAEIEAGRQEAVGSARHRRTPEIVSNLFFGFNCLLEFASEVGAVSSGEAGELRDAAWQALGRAAGAQEQAQSEADPVRVFFENLSSAVSSGRAHFAGRDGRFPDEPARWGWRQDDNGDWRPSGDLVGWVEEDDLYIDAASALAVAQDVARRGGEALALSSSVLPKRLRDVGALLSVDETRRSPKVRRTLGGKVHAVLHVGVAALEPSTAAPSDNGDIRDKEGGADEPADPPPPGGDDLVGALSAGEIAGIVGGAMERERARLGIESEPLSRMETMSDPDTTDLAPEACRNCGRRNWWRSYDTPDVWHCATCLPPPSDGEPVEAVVVGPDGQQEMEL